MNFPVAHRVVPRRAFLNYQRVLIRDVNWDRPYRPTLIQAVSSIVRADAEDL
jgi:hypothetical protein